MYKNAFLIILIHPFLATHCMHKPQNRSNSIAWQSFYLYSCQSYQSTPNQFQLKNTASFNMLHFKDHGTHSQTFFHLAFILEFNAKSLVSPWEISVDPYGFIQLPYGVLFNNLEKVKFMKCASSCYVFKFSIVL